MTRGLLTIVALCLAVPAAAQQPPAQPTPHLPPVVVEGARVPPERTESEAEAREEIRRVPGSVDLIGERQIDESRAANLKDVLDFTPGVWIRPRFGAADESQISIRGSGLRNNFHLRGVNILLDGFPLRQRRRLRRLRVARAARHQAHRGLQGRQRVALRRLHPRRRDQSRDQDGLRCGPRRGAQRGGLVRLPEEPPRHRPGLRPSRRLSRPDRRRAGRLPLSLRAASGARLQLVGLPAARRHHRAARPQLREES